MRTRRVVDMVRTRRILIPALLVLGTACSPPPPASSTLTVTPPASTAPASTPTASPSPTGSPTPITLPSTAQLSAPSATVVWALVAGTRLFRSSDRGDTWDERPVPTDPLGQNEVAFISQIEGWLARPAQPGTQCTFQSVGIAHTTDAGATWVQLVAAAGFSVCGACRQAVQRASRIRRCAAWIPDCLRPE